MIFRELLKDDLRQIGPMNLGTNQYKYVRQIPSPGATENSLGRLIFGVKMLSECCSHDRLSRTTAFTTFSG